MQFANGASFDHPHGGCGRIVGPFGPVRSPYVQPRIKGKSPRYAEAHRRRRESRQDVRRSRQDPAPLGGSRGQAAAEVPRGQVRALRRRGPGQGDGDGAGRRVLQGDRGNARHREPRCCTLLAERRRNEGGADGRSLEKARGRRAGVRRLRGRPRGEDPAARAGERHPEGSHRPFKSREPRRGEQHGEDRADRQVEAGDRPPLRRAHRFLEDLEELL